MITSPGFYPHITPREYFAEPCPAPALTASGIKALLGGTPADLAYQHPALNPDGDAAASSVAKRFGDVAHQLALGKGRGYAVGDFDAWRSNEAKAFKAKAEEDGLTPIKRAEFDAAQTCAKIMDMRIGLLLGMLGTGPTVDRENEVVIAWQEESRHGPIWCRAMLDVWSEDTGCVAECKFTTRLADGVFEAHASTMGWDLQAAWYLRGLNALQPERAGRLRFINVLVNPNPPHLGRAREADEATIYSCQSDIERAIDTFASCLKVQSWPGYSALIEPWTAKSWTMAERAARAMEDADA